MKKLLLAAVLFLMLPQALVAETLYGLELAPESMRERHLNHYMELFQEFCVGRQSQQEVKKNLLSTGRFQPAEGYEGVYEEYFEGLSYAVTPDSDVCTVDVLLEHQAGKLLFSMDEVHKRIARQFNHRLDRNSNEVMDGPNGESVQTVVSYFRKDGVRGTKLRLMYPTDNQSVFYMTLDYYFK
jgi:hypothetical protein